MLLAKIDTNMIRYQKNVRATNLLILGLMLLLPVYVVVLEDELSRESPYLGGNKVSCDPGTETSYVNIKSHIRQP